MGHWYDKNGDPRHFEGPSGRGTTLREARKNGWWPSVTTVLDVLAKPALISWLQETALLKSLEMPPGDDLKAWVREVMAAARQDTLAKADAGTAIHDALETYFSPSSAVKSVFNELGEYLPICEAVDAALIDYCGEREWVPEVQFSDNQLGYGGKCDLHSADGGWIVDFKTKDGDCTNQRGWPEQEMQLAAYRHALPGVRPDARMLNVFISRDFDQYPDIGIYEHKGEHGFAAFCKALDFWQISKKYGPAWDVVK